jgi:membrane-associated phospholipid phosphatase
MRMTAIAAHAPWKIAGIVAYFASFSLYLLIANAGLARAVIVPWTPLDLAIPVMPALLFVYLGQLLVLGIPFFLLDDFGRWLRAVLGLTAVAALAFIVYLVFPTALAQSPSIESGIEAMRAFDCRGNALPSLHAACALYAILLMHGITGSRLVLTAGWIWTALVLLACVSLRQHTILDLVAGAALGALIAWAAGVHRKTP